MDNLKNLLKLSSDINISIYTKRNKLRSKNVLLKEVEKLKKKEEKKSNNLLSNLAKLSQIGGNPVNENLSKINEFIKILPTVYDNNIIIDESEYYECFSNC